MNQTPIDDGGSAFPTQTYDNAAAMNGFAVTVTDKPGMSLRDYFAAAALQGLCTRPPEDFDHADEVAITAYAAADAMIAARKEGA